MKPTTSFLIKQTLCHPSLIAFVDNLDSRLQQNAYLFETNPQYNYLVSIIVIIKLLQNNPNLIKDE
jgi:hypothetical protein